MSVEGGGDEIVKWIDPIQWIDSPHVIVTVIFFRGFQPANAARYKGWVQHIWLFQAHFV